jgi:hypothetical protein
MAVIASGGSRATVTLARWGNSARPKICQQAAESGWSEIRRGGVRGRGTEELPHGRGAFEGGQADAEVGGEGIDVGRELLFAQAQPSADTAPLTV